MRAPQAFRWWVLLPLLLIFIVPAWMKLGDFLGYDLLPALQDPAPLPHRSELLASCFYTVWYGLVLVTLPGGALMLLFDGFILEPMRFWIGLLVISAIYSGILFLLRLWWLRSRQRAIDDLASRTTNDA